MAHDPPSVSSYSELWRDESERVAAALTPEDLTDPDGGAGDHEPPDQQLRRDMRMALQLMYHHPASPAARTLLRRARGLGRLVLGEGLLEAAAANGAFPLDRARVRRASAHVDWLLGYPLDVEALLEAAHDFRAWCRQRTPWDDVLQAHWIGAIHLTLIAGELSQTGQLIECHPHLGHHGDELQLLVRILEGALELRDPTPSLLEEFDRFFDDIRHPHPRPGQYREVVELRLELAMIRERFFTSPDGSIDPATVLRSVSRDSPRW